MSDRAQHVQNGEATLALPTPGRRRIGFGPALEAQAAAADLSALGGLNALIEAANPILAAVPQIRHALRHPDPATLRARLREQISKFETNARAAGIPDADIDCARYAVCALLDDAASATPWGRDWAGGGLLAELCQEQSGGESFFLRLDAMLARPAGHRELLQLFYVCLALGFEGRYRGGEGGRQALAQTRARLHEILSEQQGQPSFELSFRWQGAPVPMRRVPAGIAIWSIASMCALLLGGLYFAYSVSLAALSDPVARDIARLRPLRSDSTDAVALTRGVTSRSRALAQAIGLSEVDVTEEAGGLSIVLKADELFASGSARLHGGLEPVILKVAAALDRVPGPVVVAGHTDDVPIRTARFPSNWELSAERARSVLRLMSSRMHDTSRLRAEGLADSDPVVPNDSAATRARNRRVTIFLRTMP